MKIYGKKYLSSNSYHRIVIKIVNDEYVINVSGSDDSFKTIKLSNDFLDTIKCLDDDNKVLEIVNHFLRNTLVTGLVDSEEFIYRYQHFNAVNGNNRLLMLQIKNNEIGKKILNNIHEKYLLDRARYPFKDGCYLIAPYNNKCSYKDYYIYFAMNKDKQISKADLEFLKAFLISKIDTNYHTYLYYQNTIINNANSFCLADDVVDSNFIKDIVQDSNKKFIEKQLQLKL